MICPPCLENGTGRTNHGGEFYLKEVVIEVWGDFACFTMPLGEGGTVNLPLPSPVGCQRDPFRDLHETERIPVAESIASRCWSRFAISASSAMRSNAPSVQTPVSAEEERTQRQTTALQNVRYRIAASIIPRPAFVGRETQLYEQALRRIRGGKCYFQPSLGLREFTCYFDESDGTRPPIQESLDAGLMVYDLFTPEDVGVTKKTKIQMSLFHAVMENGVISDSAL